MNIIEKLGIKPIETYFYIVDGDYCDPIEVRELEQQRNELLEALIETTVKLHEESIVHNWFETSPAMDRLSHNIKIIEKATDESWKEIKELLNE